ncbi:MAG: class I SAM-dependent rRNA methyltransferase [Lunatimonas sp.]|uniref:class I SAM-dependent rRNA methyltransferase n=1 Tax=Lunatimonas sp. TaxID=2060141 RepID=UPI00263BB4E4|nr:class I SAM-dependent rRNA methyltransferase [Lunatimonas sp.]MCC5936486.1 class I SAM-dependent rRNA methyltransferase [Lunatimonas sp.]
MQSNYPVVHLKKGKDISIQRRHHWVFSGAIAKKDGGIAAGDLVEVVDEKGRFLAVGFYGEGSIAVRIAAFDQGPLNASFWVQSLRKAYDLRRLLGLTDNLDTNVYRLFHGEGDLMPGLIIDYYNGTAVVQAHHEGIHRHLTDIASALQSIYGENLKAVYDKSQATISGNSLVTDGFVFGTPETNQVREYGNLFEIDWEKGQKTGFFIDQRENRYLLGKYAAGKKVLNTFCYSGGFSVYALNQGAKEVHSVDISAAAVALTDQNVAINGLAAGRHRSVAADVMHYLKEVSQDFEVIVLDPPAFAKHVRSRHQAVQAYKRINSLAIKNIRSGGLLFTFSCSQVVDMTLFSHTVTAAAMEAGRQVKIIHQLTQPGDHPINIFHQETAYLKGLVLYVV